jgi:1-acyl-sn-glycerol-3-phosphate acyltransferase
MPAPVTRRRAKSPVRVPPSTTTAANQEEAKMGFLGECCRVWFGITLMLTLLPYTLFTRIVWLLGCMHCMSQRTTEDVNVCGGVLTFRLLVMLNPQIRLKKVGGKLDWSPSKQGPPAMYLMNHTSFFDFFLFTSLMPLDCVMTNHIRTIMANGLFNVPILGKSIGDHVGSFRVYFRASKGLTDGNSDDFGVDREKQQRETDKINAHVASGGALGFCPEGTVSKTPPNLQLFRKGSFGWAVEHGMQVWGLVMLGNYECWPKRCALGGYPCTIYLDINRLLTPEPDEDPAAVAGACQQRMQQTMESLIQMRDADRKGSSLL